MYTKKEMIEDGSYDDSKNFSHKIITKFFFPCPQEQF